SARAASLSDSLMAASTSSSSAPSRNAAMAMGTLMVDQAGSLPSSPAKKSFLSSTMAKEMVAPNSSPPSVAMCSIAASRSSSSITAISSAWTESEATDEVVAVGAPGVPDTEQPLSTSSDPASVAESAAFHDEAAR